MKKTILRLLAVSFFVMFTFSVASGAEESIKIGVLLPFTGPLAQQGEDQFRGMELARVIINEGGGIGGKKIEYVKVDVPNPPAAITGAERLFTKEKVNIAIGTFASSLSNAASEVAERHGKVFFEVSAILDTLTQRGFKYYFRFTNKASQFGLASANFVAECIAPKLGISMKELKVAVIGEDMIGTYFLPGAVNRLKELGATIVVHELYPLKTLDLSPLIMKLKGAKPDVVVQACFVPDAILFWRQAKELNYNPKAIVGLASGHAIDDFPKAFGKDANFVTIADEIPMINPKAILPSVRPSNPEFLARFRKMWDRTPYVQASMGYAGPMLLYQHVLPKVPSMEPEELRKAILSLDLPYGSTVLGFGGKFAPPGHPDAGQNLRTVIVGAQWLDGKLVAVWPKEYALADAVFPMPTWAERK